MGIVSCHSATGEKNQVLNSEQISKYQRTSSGLGVRHSSFCCDELGKKEMDAAATVSMAIMLVVHTTTTMPMYQTLE